MGCTVAVHAHGDLCMHRMTFDTIQPAMFSTTVQDFVPGICMAFQTQFRVCFTRIFHIQWSVSLVADKAVRMSGFFPVGLMALGTLLLLAVGRMAHDTVQVGMFAWLHIECYIDIPVAIEAQVLLHGNLGEFDICRFMGIRMTLTTFNEHAQVE